MTSNQGRQELADEPGGDDLISHIPFISDVYALLSGLILAPRFLIEKHFADRRFVDTPGLKNDQTTGSSSRRGNVVSTKCLSAKRFSTKRRDASSFQSQNF
jgi:hypothetical protein